MTISTLPTVSPEFRPLPWKKTLPGDHLLQINLRYADEITLTAESEEEVKNFLMKVKKESKKAGLKLNIHKTKIITSSLIISWQGEGETDFTFWAPKSL